MDSPCYVYEVEWLAEFASRNKARIDVEAKAWQVLVRYRNGIWNLVDVAFAHRDSAICRQCSADRIDIPGNPALVGGLETLEVLFSHLPLVPLDTGSLLGREIFIYGPDNSAYESSVDRAGFAGYTTEWRQWGEWQLHDLWLHAGGPFPGMTHSECIKTQKVQAERSNITLGVYRPGTSWRQGLQKCVRE